MLVRSRSVPAQKADHNANAADCRAVASIVVAAAHRTTKDIEGDDAVRCCPHHSPLDKKTLIYELEDSWRTWRVGNGGKPFHSVLFDCRLYVQDASAETRERKMQSLTFSLESRRESTRIAFPLFTISSMQK